MRSLVAIQPPANPRLTTPKSQSASLLHSVQGGQQVDISVSSALENYLSKIRELTQATGIYAYRGQEDSHWSLHSAATRRLLKGYGSGVLRTPDFQRTYLEYHENVLIEPARSKGFGVDNGRAISDLEILAKLQHLGAATGLLDFSWNPLMALCIACQDQSCAGKVFLVDTLDTINIAKINTTSSDQGIAQIFSRDSTSPQLLCYEPMLSGEAASRILRQRSVFMIGRPLVPENSDFIGEIEVAQADKPAVLADLELLDYSYQSLFQDIYGFAEANSVQALLAADQVDYGQMGNRSYQDGDYSKAVEYYTRFASGYPNNHEAYFLRGNARAASRDHESALHDYSQAIALSAGSIHDLISHMFYFNRANSKSAVGNLEDALDDYAEQVGVTRAIQRRYSIGQMPYTILGDSARLLLSMTELTTTTYLTLISIRGMRWLS